MSLAGSIHTNNAVLGVLNNIRLSSEAADTTSAQLSSGLAVSTPADNPAAYITAQGMTADIGGAEQALSDTNQDIALTQTAQQAIQQQLGIAQNLYAIAVQAADGTQTPADRQSLQGVAETLLQQINNVAATTQYNGINLLNGTFKGYQFQTGAQSGQNMSLSIGSTLAADLGPSSAPVLPRVTYSFVGTSHEYSSGSIVVNGPRGKSAAIQVKKNEAASTLAQAINQYTPQTGVIAKSSNSILVKFDPSSANGTAFGTWQFGLASSSAAGPGTSVTISSANPDQVVNQINNSTAKTGVTAVNTASGIILSQAQGKSIVLGMRANGISNNLTTASGASIQHGVSPAVIHGTLSLVSSGTSFSVSNGNLIGSGSSPPHNHYTDALSNINLSTSSGAADAIHVIQGAMTQLSQIAGGIGAVQEGLTTTADNLRAGAANETNALGAVQDANIPKAASTLSEQEIEAQIGVAALKQSSEIQQSYLSLLP